MIILKALAVLIINFIMYLAFGSFFTVKKNTGWSAAVTVSVGFFAYYGLFALFCLPVMFTYRPLSLLSHIWIVPCAFVTIASLLIYKKAWIGKFNEIKNDISQHRGFWITVAAVTALSVFLVVITYNFTLDAAYYVANVTTNVDTDMINVYDAFTGSWQDHFELRYVFATYYVNDAVICSLSGIPALVQTKGVMSAVVMLIVNGLYVMVSRTMTDNHRSALLMYILMSFMNYMFISIYTASNFLMTRTYEGKTVVGCISLILIFVLFMIIVKDGLKGRDFITLFAVCLGSATVSSTANMVIPAAVFVFFMPYALIGRKYSIIPKILLCIVPELAMMIVYVLYVKGYFAVYTFPR